MLFLFTSCALGVLIPIPKRYPGIQFGPSDAAIRMELYVDPLCPVCAMIWPTIQTVLEKYPTQLNCDVHFLPLPYHTWAYLITRSIIAVNMTSNEEAKTMISNILLGDQDKFGNSVMADTTQNQAVTMVAEYVATTTKVTQDEFLANYKNSESDSNARIEFKFCASQRVSGTPVVFLNGIESDLGANTPISTWTSVLDELLA